MAKANAGTKSQGPKLELQIEGSLTACTLTVTFKKDQDIGFYLGNQPGNSLQQKLESQSGQPFVVRIGPDGVGIHRDLDMSDFKDVNMFNHLTAISSDGKKSNSVSLSNFRTGPPKTKKGKRLVVTPDKELTTSHSNWFAVNTQTFDDSGEVGASCKVVYTFTRPVKLLDKHQNVLVKSTTEYATTTNTNGDLNFWFCIVGDTEVSMKAKLVGTNETLERKFEYI